jgi:hypothetical protein
MPPGEEMFKYHGYSGPCPKPSLAKGAIPPEPPTDRRPHRDRIADIAKMCPVGKIAAVAIDDTPEHRAYYLHELGKYKDISVVGQGVLAEGVYVIKVTKTMVN